MCFHYWSKWQDVDIVAEIKTVPMWPYPISRQVIKQQKRCRHCNMVKTRSS